MKEINPFIFPLTHEELKKLYIQKMLAMESTDLSFLTELKNQHPELFDKEFLYKLLLNELALHGAELSTEFEGILKHSSKLH